MSQKKNAFKYESTPKSHPQCYIHDKVYDIYVSQIRENVCVKNEALIEFEGEFYCLFHLPTDDKDGNKLLKIFRERLREINDKYRRIEVLPEDEKLEAKKYLSYDFRFVWFNYVTNFQDFEFLGRARFDYATFSGIRNNFTRTVFKVEAVFDNTKFLTYADFWDATFNGYTSFVNCVFEENAMFGYANFEKDANFQKTKFLKAATFYHTGFKAEADFSKTIIKGDCYFNSTQFSKKVNFSKVRFSKNERTSFNKSTFSSDTYFDRTRFNNNVDFSSVTFAKETNTLFRRVFFNGNVDFQFSTGEGFLRFIKVYQGKENKFDFQEATFDKASRISFHTMKLQPNWFVNVDSRKFVFTDINWENIKWKRNNDGITIELERLSKRRILNSKQLFKITCRQLAENAENNNRFEEASKFRQMAFECERLERKERISKWWQDEVNGFVGFISSLPKQLTNFPFDLIHWLYRWTSGYGENRLWAANVLLFGVLIVFPLIYSQTNFYVCQIEKIGSCETRTLTISESIRQSLATAFLQNVESRKPNSAASEIFTILEKILAPLQAALLALAIRRKFMR